MEIEAAFLREFLSHLGIVKDSDRAIPQLEALLRIADAGAGITFKGKPTPREELSSRVVVRKPAKVAKPSKTARPAANRTGRTPNKINGETHIDRMRAAFKGSNKPMKMEDFFDDFRSAEGTKSMSDNQVKHLIRGTAWRLKKVGELAGDGHTGWTRTELMQ